MSETHSKEASLPWCQMPVPVFCLFLMKIYDLYFFKVSNIQKWLPGYLSLMGFIITAPVSQDDISNLWDQRE